jgi:predicted NBD/HSP70 family sugar kinase
LTTAFFSTMKKSPPQQRFCRPVPRSELKTRLEHLDARAPEARIVRFMSERGAASAADIANGTGLARSTISTALAALRDAKVVIEVAQSMEAREVGRPTSVFALNPKAGTCVGLHLGLGEIRLLVADVSHAVLHRADIELGPEYTPETAVRAARKAIRDAYKRHGLSLHSLLGVGVAVAGPVAPDGRVQRASIVPTWAGVDIREVFEPVLGTAVFVDNESNCSALAEMTWGVATDIDDFVYFKIDMGLGGAIVVQRRVLTGIAGAGGEFGHISIDPNGGLCRCGNRGCLELTASFRPVVERMSRRLGRSVAVEDVVERAIAGDADCADAISRIAGAAGRGLGIIGSILNPGTVVIGGRGVAAGPLLIEPLEASYERHTLLKRKQLRDIQQVRIIQGRFIEDGSLMGAVALVLRRHAVAPTQVGFTRLAHHDADAGQARRRARRANLA